VCHEVSPVQTAMRNCTRDEGRSFEAGSQVLASNRFLHYAFDMWMARTYPHIPFERYAEPSFDNIVGAGDKHWRNLSQAERAQQVPQSSGTLLK